MPFQTITSTQNPRLKNLVRLRDGSYRRRSEMFLVEGFREIQRASTAGWKLETIYFCPDDFRDTAVIDWLDEQELKGIEIIQLSHDAFAKAAYRENPDGLLAVSHMRHQPLESCIPSAQALIAIVEGVEKPGNLGALMRTANAAGAEALIVANPVTDIYNPNAIRASQGAFFDLPVFQSDNETVQEWLQSHKFQTIVTTPAASAMIWDYDLTQRSALVFGAEDTGLSPDWLDNHFPPAALPVNGVTDSLNVAAAAAVMLFEAVRQRTSVNHSS